MVQNFQERRQHSVMTSEALACDYSEMRTPFVLYPETYVICSPISCCDAACFAILTFSEPIQTLVMKVSRGRVICHGTCALQFYDEGSMLFYSALLKFSY